LEGTWRSWIGSKKKSQGRERNEGKEKRKRKVKKLGWPLGLSSKKMSGKEREKRMGRALMWAKNIKNNYNLLLLLTLLFEKFCYSRLLYFIISNTQVT